MLYIAYQIAYINITCGTEACHFSGIVDLLQKLEWKFVRFHEVEIVFHAQVFGGLVFTRVRFIGRRSLRGYRVQIPQIFTNALIDTRDIYYIIQRHPRCTLLHSEIPQIYISTIIFIFFSLGEPAPEGTSCWPVITPSRPASCPTSPS